ncbi:polyketide synthase [Colletotrichum chrysophilum]|uniref:Polyketide synthase n=1 Tax=Colletotrichum chrysophilum TaxID=1836956 RepID=A0AAD8ZZ50_9PEZI|nr:polyketide synthase [Colletotrichum chrysophilum]
MCANDYADNVASHPPNAFSTLGTLRAFQAGRISNFFGCSGEASTIDTECSSSAVAINRACVDIIAGKCTTALAGGANVFTSPNFFQNLNTGKFLSPTGQCKSFDTKADGYCRGEGVGLLLLKKLSTAQAEGDNILAVISGSAVRQNSNETYITVPHGPSQSELYEKVLRSATRRARLGLLPSSKSVLMIHHKRIPPQASFTTLNPQITLSDSDRIAITTTGIEWKSSGPLTVCVNNYGASGSNAALIVTEPPPLSTTLNQTIEGNSRSIASSYPFIITAFSQSSLFANVCCCARLSCSRTASSGVGPQTPHKLPS